MKKALLTIVAFNYLLLASGVALNIHHCMGKVASVGFFRHSECRNCGMKSGEGLCCNDEYKIIKVTDSHVPAINEVNIISPVIIHELIGSHVKSPVSDSHSFVEKLDNSPPCSPSISLCILNSVFRI